MRRGYTLVEVLVAMVILGLVLPGLAAMLISSRKAQVASFRMDQAYAYGQVVYDSLNQLPDWIVVADTLVQKIGGTDYTAEITKDPSGTVTQLVVKVTWMQSKQKHMVQMQGVLGGVGSWR